MWWQCGLRTGSLVDRLAGAVASVHPWEHPLIELDRVSLWMPPEG